MTRAWRITKADSADLGFATSASTYGAVTVEEFRAWAEYVVLETPDDDLPPYMIDMMLGPNLEADNSHPKYFGITGFLPYDPLLDSNQNAAALTGIGHLRGTVETSGHDPWISRDAALAALARNAVIPDRFAEVFPMLSVPAGVSA